MKHTIFICLFLFALVAPALVHAQPPPPASPAAVPIDGGLGILLAAGAGLGGYKAWIKSKKG